MDGGKSAVRWFAEIAVRAYGSVPAHSSERNFGAARLQRSRLQSTRPCDCKREHLLTQVNRTAMTGQVRLALHVGSQAGEQRLTTAGATTCWRTRYWVKPTRFCS